MKGSPRRVVLVANTSWYLYNFRAGTIRALVERGFAVHCVAPRDEFSARLEQELGASFVAANIAGAVRNPLVELWTVLRMLFLMWRIKPLYVFNFTIKPNIFSGLACWMLGVPFANNVSGLGTTFLHDRWIYRLIRRSYIWVNTRAEQLFFQNPEDHALFLEGGLPDDVPVTVLPGSGVNLERFRFEELPKGPVAFLMVARLLGDKGVREYAAAAREVKKIHPACNFVLVGGLGVNNATAITREEVEAWVEEGAIDYRGELEDVRPALAACQVLVLPSYREGMPRTVLEAAAVGRPSIVSDVVGCRQAIEAGRTGWFCQARDTQSLVEVMLYVIASDRMVLVDAGRQARRLAEERFSEDVVIKAYLGCVVDR